MLLFSSHSWGVKVEHCELQSSLSVPQLPQMRYFEVETNCGTTEVQRLLPQVALQFLCNIRMAQPHLKYTAAATGVVADLRGYRELSYKMQHNSAGQCLKHCSAFQSCETCKTNPTKLLAPRLLSVLARDGSGRAVPRKKLNLGVQGKISMVFRLNNVNTVISTLTVQANSNQLCGTNHFWF